MIKIFVNVAVDVFIFWLPFLLLMLVGFQVEKHYLTLLSRVGGKTLVMIPASFAVPVHELSHYIVAKLCGHKVLQVRLFTPNNSGTLGFVKHEYKPGIVSVFTNMLIGLAPIAGGSLAIWAITYCLMPSQIQLFHNDDMLTSSNIVTVAGQYIEAAFRITVAQWVKWEFWLWCFLVTNVAVFCVPSAADFVGAAWGISLTVVSYMLAMYVMGENNQIHHAFITLATMLTPVLTLSIIFIAGFTLILFFIDILRRKKGQSKTVH